MEVLALAGLLGVGYVLTKSSDPKGVESFVSDTNPDAPDGSNEEFPQGGQPPWLYAEPRTAPGYGTTPGKPAGKSHHTAGLVSTQQSICKLIPRAPVTSDSCYIPSAHECAWFRGATHLQWRQARDLTSYRYRHGCQ